MNLLKGIACLVVLAGVGVIVDGTLRDVGIVLLLEGGVLFTFVGNSPK
jgi:hypothetical protein